MKKKSTVNVIITLVLLGVILLPAPYPGFSDDPGDKVDIGITVKLKSRILNEERGLFIYLPDGYSESKDRYPVLYICAPRDFYFHYTSGIVRFLSKLSITPKIMVVGLRNMKGNRDLTPTKTAGYGPTSGGADHFLKYIKNEVIPYVDKNYRTQPCRIIWGHSIVGTFCIYTFLSAPDTFNAYIVSSPWLIYDEEEMFLLKNTESFLKKRSGQKNFLFLTVGNEPRLNPSIEAFIKILKNKKPVGVEWKFTMMQNENHRSIMVKSLAEGLRALYSGWENIPDSCGKSDVKMP